MNKRKTNHKRCFISISVYHQDISILIVLIYKKANVGPHFLVLQTFDDTNQLDKQMTKDTTNSSQLGHSSQHKRQGLTKSQKSLSRGRTRHEPKYQLFFILVFLQEKLSK